MALRITHCALWGTTRLASLYYRYIIVILSSYYRVFIGLLSGYYRVINGLLTGCSRIFAVQSSGQPHQTLTHLCVARMHYWDFYHKVTSPGTRTPSSAGSLAQTEWICCAYGDVKRKAGVRSTLSAVATRKPVA